MFLVVYIALGLLTYKDFGLTWDEPVNYNRGVITYEHLFDKKVKDPFKFNKKHGHLDVQDRHEKLPSLQRYLNVQPERLYDYYCYSGFYPMVLFMLNKDKKVEVYHLLNILFASGIFIALYALLYHQYKDQRMAILGPLFLFFTPRFVGHIPANPKDIPFAVMYFITCVSLYFFASSKKVLSKILILGLLCGITLSMRTAGVTLFVVIVLFDIYAFYIDKNGSSQEMRTWTQFLLQEMQSIIIIGVIAVAVSTVTWPYLGMNVIPNAIELLGIKRRFFWEGTVLYQGKVVQGLKLPGHYLITWFFIAIPLIILIPALFSLLLIKKWFRKKIYILLILIVLFNISLYAIIKPTVYDGLRHFLFVVPAISTLAALAIIEFIKFSRLRFIRISLVIIVFIGMSAVLKEMVSLHPYQYIFFNSLVGGLQGAYQRYDTEYWGASYNEAINWFKENIATDENKTYKVHIWGIKYYMIYQAENIKKTALNHADYLFLFTRPIQQEPQKGDLLHTVQRKGVPLVYVLKNR
jgi:hypothetical protein